MNEGSVVICDTGQAGTLIWKVADQASVLLQSGEIWTGAVHSLRKPQDAADLAACPILVDKKDPKPNKK